MRMKLIGLCLLLLILVANGCYNPINYFDEQDLYKMPDGKILPTFDDGPIPATNDILGLLQKHNLKAAFFVMGKNAEQYPDILARIVNEGHYLGNHTYNHKSLLKISFDESVSEIQRTQEIISNYTNIKWFRPPYGEMDYQVRNWLKNNGFQVVRWTAGASSENDLRKGDIVLMHDVDDLEKIDYILGVISEINNQN